MATEAEVQHKRYGKPDSGKQFVMSGHHNVRSSEEPDVTGRIAAEFNGLTIETIRHYKNGTMITAGFTLDRQQAAELAAFLQAELAKPDWR